MAIGCPVRACAPLITLAHEHPIFSKQANARLGEGDSTDLHRDNNRPAAIAESQQRSSQSSSKGRVFDMSGQPASQPRPLNPSSKGSVGIAREGYLQVSAHHRTATPTEDLLIYLSPITPMNNPPESSTREAHTVSVLSASFSFTVKKQVFIAGAQFPSHVPLLFAYQNPIFGPYPISHISIGSGDLFPTTTTSESDSTIL